MAEDQLPERLDVVAVAPHPDDLEILCGGTLAKMVKQGYKVGIFDLTSGEPTPRGSLETRKIEAENARGILNVPVRINVELPNRVLMDGPEARFAIKRCAEPTSKMINKRGRSRASPRRDEDAPCPLEISPELVEEAITITSEKRTDNMLSL